VIVALSADALADAPLDDVIAACERRGIRALCLEVTSLDELERSAEQLRSHDIALVAFSIRSVDAVVPGAAAAASNALGSVILPAADVPRAWLDAFVAAGGAVANPVELDPQLHDVADQLRSVIGEGSLPSHILLRGGGPEAVQFEGRGIGSLMAQLSVAGYRGVLILAPSGRAMRQIWKTWLFNRRNWGCGSKASDPSLVEIQ
jgi:hypothetical protein